VIVVGSFPATSPSAMHDYKSRPPVLLSRKSNLCVAVIYFAATVVRLVYLLESGFITA
jgi:hypothetical protein